MSAIGLPYSPPNWTNQPLTLYHGTVDVHAASILSGVNVSLGRSGTDFGRGFYTTTVQRQADTWAGQLAQTMTRRLPSAKPAVLAFEVKRDDLAALDSLWFVRGQFDAEDFWSLIFYCRGGGLAHNRSSSSIPTAVPAWYDVVIGPVAAAWRQRLTIYDADQISFHTSNAAAVLNRSRKWRVS